MDNSEFQEKVRALLSDHNKFIGRRNIKRAYSNGIYDKYEYPVITAKHTPIFWRYDLDPNTNPYFILYKNFISKILFII